MQREPLFSIVTVCYNSQETIRQTLQSVCSQRFIDYEYIIVDGASSDSTMDIVRSYEPRFEGRLTFISEPDTGIYNAFNKGCKRAKGKYIWIVNSDDFLEEYALEKIAEFLKSNNQKEKFVVIGDINYIDKQGLSLKVLKATTEKVKRAYKKDEMVNHPATIVPRDIYEKLGYYDERFRIAADMDWFHRVFAHKVRFECLGMVITNMRQGGMSSNTPYKFQVKERHLFFMNKYGVSFSYLWHFLIWHIKFIRNKC